MTSFKDITPGESLGQHNAALVLADGSIFFGLGIGAKGKTFGEICFNTSMTGYQEILTDPSYSGQIITFTFPHIGNTGVTHEDFEANEILATGLIIRADITEPSNFRSEQHLDAWLAEKGKTGICGVDTRELTRRTRLNGSQNVGIVYFEAGEQPDLSAFLEEVRSFPAMKGKELAKDASCDAENDWDEALWEWNKGHSNDGNGEFHVVAVDFGAKRNILRHLVSAGCRVTVVPADTTADAILAKNPDGVFLSNGPGDPAATGEYALTEITQLVESGIPIFGICLGHQLLGLAMGCETEKMHQGHRGANHPVQDIKTGRVMITSQNHGFVVAKDSLPDHVEVTHISLFDQTIQGIAHKQKPIFSVQGHPEASPGPHDTAALFAQFVDSMKTAKKEAA